MGSRACVWVLCTAMVHFMYGGFYPDERRESVCLCNQQPPLSSTFWDLLRNHLKWKNFDPVVNHLSFLQVLERQRFDSAFPHTPAHSLATSQLCALLVAVLLCQTKHEVEKLKRKQNPLQLSSKLLLASHHSHRKV